MRFKFVEEFLTEGKNLQMTIDQYFPKFKELEDKEPILTKYYLFKTDILYKEVLKNMIELDPTYEKDSGTTGSYGIWILNKIVKDNEFRKSLAEPYNQRNLTSILTEFDKNKNKIQNKDINSYKSILEIKDALTDIQISARQKERAYRHSNEMTKKVWENENWEVYIPINYIGSLTLGKGTTWCTADSRLAQFFCEYASGKYSDYIFTDVSKIQVGSKFERDICNKLGINKLSDLYPEYSDMVVIQSDEDGKGEYEAINPFINFVEKYGEHLYIFINKKDRSKKYQVYYSKQQKEIFIGDKDDDLYEVKYFINEDMSTLPFFKDYLDLIISYNLDDNYEIESVSSVDIGG